MKLVSAGAARTVTGSCHLLEIRDRRILVDCGLFQGSELEELNDDDFPFDPAEVDALLLTHGHLDHTGRIPLLVKRGFDGPVHATRATRRIADVILQDAAKLQQEDHDRARRRGRGSVPEPLYVPGDVPPALSLFVDTAFDAWIDLGAGVRARFRPAGHILGSAFVEIETPDGRVAASGDLGNRESPLQETAPLPFECDAVLVETTYANRTHRDLAATRAEFAEVLKRAAAAGGVVMIPSFALERTQVVLFELKRMMDAGEIPALDVFLDSPMAAKMTRLYEECANEFRPPIAAALKRGEDPIEPDTLKITASPEDSKRLNDLHRSAIVIAGSGMMTGGRIVHHLEHHLWREDSSLVVVGYQARGTRGRRIVDGAKEVRIHGHEVEVRARVSTINGLSAHADQDDLLRWLEGTGGAKAVLVHGEPEVMDAFEKILADRGRDSFAPERGREYDLV